MNKKVVLACLAAIALVGSVVPSSAAWRIRGAHHHHHHFVRWAAPWRHVVSHHGYGHVGFFWNHEHVFRDNPSYYWSPFSVVDHVLVHRSIEIGPTPRLIVVH